MMLIYSFRYNCYSFWYNYNSLLGLEAEKFSDERTLEAFRESQNRVISMALIHEELYEGKGMETIDFAVYLRKLTMDLLSSYAVETEK